MRNKYYVKELQWSQEKHSNNLIALGYKNKYIIRYTESNFYFAILEKTEELVFSDFALWNESLASLFLHLQKCYEEELWDYLEAV